MEYRFLSFVALFLGSFAIFARNNTQFFLEYLGEVLRVAESYFESDAGKRIIGLLQQFAGSHDSDMA